MKWAKLNLHNWLLLYAKLQELQLKQRLLRAHTQIKLMPTIKPK